MKNVLDLDFLLDEDISSFLKENSKEILLHLEKTRVSPKT